MSTDRTHFKKEEKGYAMEKAQELNQSFSENSDGTSYVPNENLRKKKTKKITKNPKKKLKP